MADRKRIWDSGAEVVERLRAAGHQAWLVGGCVRDRLLGRPIKDADVATSAEPDEVEALFPRTVAVGKAFGVIKVLPSGRPDDRTTGRPDSGNEVVGRPDDRTTGRPDDGGNEVVGRPDDRTTGRPDDGGNEELGRPDDRTTGRPDDGGNEVEVASLRADDRYVDGRRPVAIRRGTLQEDAERRDLTVNALYATADGTITDPVHGLPDLQARILRGIGDPAARLAEDRLRVLRVLRFAAVLDFSIEPATAAAVRQTSIDGVARERVLEELAKAGKAGAAGGFLRGCAAHGHLAAIAPCLEPDVAAAALDRLGPAPVDLVLAVWMQGLQTDAIRAWVSMQPLPAEARRTVPWLIDTAPRLAQMPISERRRALRQLRGADLAAMAAAMEPYRTRDYAQWLGQEAGATACPLRASDLLVAGVAAGPGLGAALRRAEDAWLNDATLDRTALLKIAATGA